MTEDEVNVVCKQWLIDNGYNYKGILNARPSIKSNPNGYGQVPVPDGERQVLLDHQGINDRDKILVWIEAKGSDVGMSQLLEAFARTSYAVWHGGGKGLVAVPEEEYNQLWSQREFLQSWCKASERDMGLLNADKKVVKWLSI